MGMESTPEHRAMMARIRELESQVQRLRDLLKKQQIYTGNGGWTTLTDAQIDAALEVSKP